jgi:hypothetical protein
VLEHLRTSVEPLGADEREPDTTPAL